MFSTHLSARQEKAVMSQVGLKMETVQVDLLLTLKRRAREGHCSPTSWLSPADPPASRVTRSSDRSHTPQPAHVVHIYRSPGYQTGPTHHNLHMWYIYR